MTASRGFDDLWSACTNGDLTMAKRLVAEHGKSILRETGPFGQMAIHAAAFNGYLDIVEFLVEAGSPLDEPANLGTPLHEACMKGNADVILYLLEKGANINGRGELYSPLISLMKECAYTEAALYFIEHGADLTKRDGTEMTVMDWAVQNDDVEVFIVLVDKGLVPNGVLPLDYVMAHENASIGMNPKIMRACLADTALGGELTDERMQQLLEQARRPEALATLLSVQTERKLQSAITDGADGGAVEVRRRNNMLSI